MVFSGELLRCSRKIIKESHLRQYSNIQNPSIGPPRILFPSSVFTQIIPSSCSIESLALRSLFPWGSFLRHYFLPQPWHQWIWRRRSLPWVLVLPSDHCSSLLLNIPSLDSELLSYITSCPLLWYLPAASQVRLSFLMRFTLGLLSLSQKLFNAWQF